MRAPIDLNTASKDELMQLPQVSESAAQSLVNTAPRGAGSRVSRSFLKYKV
jgi:DNA uptake protein ComE-like DNA-binding protein